MNIKHGYELSDLLLVPQPSSVNSRDNVNLSRSIGTFYLSTPIIASPMKGIVGTKLIKKIGELGGIGILHRFYSDPMKRVNDFKELDTASIRFGVAVGLNDKFYQDAVIFGASIICLDVANGYLDSVRKQTEEIANFIQSHGQSSTCLVMSGAVATHAGTKLLVAAGANLIRVGIGSGGLCTTRSNTGIGVPQATAIKDCSYADVSIVADGGIMTSGDAVKALALGADFLMIGSLFAKTYESDHDGEINGMASREFQEQFYGEVKKSVEGVQKNVIKNISLENLIKEFTWNMKSGFTYCNAINIDQLQRNAEFIVCGTNSIRKDINE